MHSNIQDGITQSSIPGIYLIILWALMHNNDAMIIEWRRKQYFVAYHHLQRSLAHDRHRHTIFTEDMDRKISHCLTLTAMKVSCSRPNPN